MMDYGGCLALLVVSSLISSAAAQYCEWNLCSPKEYCCDDNVCCTKFNTWLLIGCLLLTLVILSVGCACLYRYYCQLPPLMRSNSRSRLVVTT